MAGLCSSSSVEIGNDRVEGGASLIHKARSKVPIGFTAQGDIGLTRMTSWDCRALWDGKDALS